LPIQIALVYKAIILGLGV